jgi:hypothetical protein
MKAKPVVWYDNFTYESCGETHQIKQKLTRVAVLEGEEAKAVNRARRDGFVMTYSGTKGNQRLGFYKAETVEDKIIEEASEDRKCQLNT